MKNHCTENDSLSSGLGALSPQADTLPIWPVNFSDQDLERWRNERAFHYLEQKSTLSWWTQFKGWINGLFQDLLHWIFGEYTPAGFLAGLFEILPYLVLGILLGLAAWLFMRLSPAYANAIPQNAPQVFYSEEEEIIKSRDISSMIARAKEAGDRRLALRYYYLESLQRLENGGLITYKPEKTNASYFQELPSKVLREEFRDITRIYEYTWYGGFPVTQEQFRLAEGKYLNFFNLLKNRRW